MLNAFKDDFCPQWAAKILDWHFASLLSAQNQVQADNNDIRFCHALCTKLTMLLRLEPCACSVCIHTRTFQENHLNSVRRRDEQWKINKTMVFLPLNVIYLSFSSKSHSAAESLSANVAKENLDKFEYILGLNSTTSVNILMCWVHTSCFRSNSMVCLLSVLYLDSASTFLNIFIRVFVRNPQNLHHSYGNFIHIFRESYVACTLIINSCKCCVCLTFSFSNRF